MSDTTPFDRHTVRLHRDRAARRLDAVQDVLSDMAERLLDRLDDTTTRFTRALDIGGRGMVAPLLAKRGIETISMDLSPAMARINRDKAPNILPVAGDEEWLPFAPASFDLVVANMALHWVNDLPGALLQIRHALRPDGLLLASLPALGTLAELRTALTETEAALMGGASPRISPFPDLRDLAGLLQRAGFALPVADVEDLTFLYADPLRLLRDLQNAGESNAVSLRDRRIPPRALLPAALSSLPRQDERIRATLRMAVITGWAPAPTQPKPLAPGSGQIPLGDALK